MGEMVAMKVLFETPSGFAIFGFDGGFLIEANAVETLWTHFVSETTASLAISPLGFEMFENKSDAINPISGIDERLSRMIKGWWFGETLLVGKLEYKEIIEKELRITCRYDEAVLEVMWGLKNILHTLLPQEKSELSEEDSKRRSQGLQIFLRHHGFSIEPELVDGQMAEAACFVYHCIEIDKELLECFHKNEYLEEEGINTNGWNALKYATALLLMCTDEPSSVLDQEFSEEEWKKINDGMGKYNKEIILRSFMQLYERAVKVHQLKVEKLKELDDLVKEANLKSQRLLDSGSS